MHFRNVKSPITSDLRPVFLVLLAAATLLSTGCASTPDSGLMEGSPEEQQYIIGPADGLEVFVWGNPEVSRTVQVRPDGKVSTPLVEEMQAAGKTPKQLARDIEAKLATFIRNPQVTVIVTKFVGAYSQQVRVVGQAAKPQAISYRERMTLLDVMIAVGGLSDFAAGNKAKIIRRVNGKEIEIPARLSDLVDKGQIDANISMMPGDVVIIPESLF